TRTPTIFSTITGISGQLTNVTIAGALDMQTNNSSLNVSGNLSLPGGIVRLGDNGANFTFGQLFFVDATPQTVDGVAGAGNAGTIVFGTRSNSLIRSNTAVLTLGPNLTITGASGIIDSLGAVGIDNQGAIIADPAAQGLGLTSGTITVNGAGWTNHGAMGAQNGGTLTLNG